MERTPIFSARNPVLLVVDTTATTIKTLKSIIYLQSPEGSFTIPLNLNYPLLNTCDLLVLSRFYVQIDRIFANSRVFGKYDLPDKTTISRKLEQFIIPFVVKHQFLEAGSEPFFSDIMQMANTKIKSQYWREYHYDFLKDYQDKTKSFLTTAPVIKSTSVQAMELLTFMFNLNPCPAITKLCVEIQSNDNSKSLYELDTFETVQNDVFEFDVSLQNVLNVAESDVVNYSIFLTDESGNKISEERKYIVDTVYNEEEQTIIFQNLMGCWDTLRLGGHKSSSREFERLSFEDENYIKTDYFQESFESLTLRTGNLDYGFLKYLADELCVSTKIYLIENEQFIRLNCLSKSLETYNPTAPQEFAQIEFRIAETEIF